MALNVADYVHRRRGDAWERELARQLRELPEPERFQFISEMLKRDLLALKFANACLRNKDYFEQLLQRGLATADASSIRDWLECVVPRLGVRRVLGRLTETVATDPDAVWKAVYWLPQFVPPHETELRRAVRKLAAQVELPALQQIQNEKAA